MRQTSLLGPRFVWQTADMETPPALASDTSGSSFVNVLRELGSALATIGTVSWAVVRHPTKRVDEGASEQSRFAHALFYSAISAAIGKQVVQLWRTNAVKGRIDLDSAINALASASKIFIAALATIALCYAFAVLLWLSMRSRRALNDLFASVAFSAGFLLLVISACMCLAMLSQNILLILGAFSLLVYGAALATIVLAADLLHARQSPPWLGMLAVLTSGSTVFIVSIGTLATQGWFEAYPPPPAPPRLTVNVTDGSFKLTEVTRPKFDWIDDEMMSQLMADFGSEEFFRGYFGRLAFSVVLTNDTSDAIAIARAKGHRLRIVNLGKEFSDPAGFSESYTGADLSLDISDADGETIVDPGKSFKTTASARLPLGTFEMLKRSEGQTATFRIKIAATTIHDHVFREGVADFSQLLQRPEVVMADPPKLALLKPFTAGSNLIRIQDRVSPQSELQEGIFLYFLQKPDQTPESLWLRVHHDVAKPLALVAIRPIVDGEQKRDLKADCQSKSFETQSWEECDARMAEVDIGTLKAIRDSIVTHVQLVGTAGSADIQLSAQQKEAIGRVLAAYARSNGPL